MKFRSCPQSRAVEARRHAGDYPPYLTRMIHFGRARHSVRAANSVSEIFEICRNAKVAAPHKLNDCLELVFLFSSNSNLLVLQLALHLETLRLDRLNNLLRLVSFEALLNF
jgi:hypothetical protein